jgi:hypothetical protein
MGPIPSREWSIEMQTKLSNMLKIPTGMSLAMCLLAGTVTAQNITAIQGGILTFTNGNTNLYYTIEYRPNLTGAEEWDGSYRGLRDIKTSASTVSVPVGVFYRVSGKEQPAPASHIPKTGQTNSFATNDDWDSGKGAVWPNPRFTVITNGTDEVVADNLTGLVWVRAPHSLAGNETTQTWTNGLTFCNDLEYGGADDWRMPNIVEMRSLIDHSQYGLALPQGHPFIGIFDNQYWSSTTYANSTGQAWLQRYLAGTMGYDHKTISFHIWPVRGGE